MNCVFWPSLIANVEHPDDLIVDIGHSQLNIHPFVVCLSLARFWSISHLYVNGWDAEQDQAVRFRTNQLLIMRWLILVNPAPLCMGEGRCIKYPFRSKKQPSHVYQKQKPSPKDSPHVHVLRGCRRMASMTCCLSPSPPRRCPTFLTSGRRTSSSWMPSRITRATW